MDHPAAPLLAADLGRLPHTNNRGEQGLIHVPGFMSTTGMADEQAAEVGLLAQAVAEGIIEDLTKHGYPPTSKAEIDAKVKAAATQKATVGEVTLHCSRCRRAVLKVDASASAPKLHLGTAIAGMQAHQDQCR